MKKILVVVGVLLLVCGSALAWQQTPDNRKIKCYHSVAQNSNPIAMFGKELIFTVEQVKKGPLFIEGTYKFNHQIYETLLRLDYNYDMGFYYKIFAHIHDNIKDGKNTNVRFSDVLDYSLVYQRINVYGNIPETLFSIRLKNGLYAQVYCYPMTR